MRYTMNLRPTRLLLGFGALALAAAVGAGMASTVGTRAAPAAPVVADDAMAAAALGFGDDTSLVAAAGVPAVDGSNVANAPRGAGLLRLIIGKTERAEITVSTADGQKTMLYVRGKITAASAKSVTITLKDGTTQAFTLDSTTRVRGGGKLRAISDIATGGHGLVLGLKNADGTYTARFVRLAMPKAATPNPAGTAAP